ncbi:hypothetical protein G6F68_015856 [Rhizopus microsporus]|nr:hypothetical protein G6F68_015856 [Rhizopus microsporus]
MTLDAFPSAIASLPGARPSSIVLSRVMVAAMVWPPAMRSRISSLTAPHETPHQVDVAAGIQASARQIVHELPVFGLQRPERRDQAACAIGQLRTAAAFAAGRSHDEGLARQVVHGVDGVPGALVADAPGLRRTVESADMEASL